MEIEVTPVSDKLLSVLRDYAEKLSLHSAALIEMKWNFFIRATAFFSIFVLLIMGLSIAQSQYFYGFRDQISVIVTTSFLFVGLFLIVHYLRAYSKLKNQVGSELILCKRLVARASEILDHSTLSNQDKFVFEISLFEAERAVGDAEKSLDPASFPPPFGPSTRRKNSENNSL